VASHSVGGVGVAVDVVLARLALVFRPGFHYKLRIRTVVNFIFINDGRTPWGNCMKHFSFAVLYATGPIRVCVYFICYPKKKDMVKLCVS